MPRLHLKLTLEADLVQTARPQTMGVHECLEYVRGATLYGVAAAALYTKLGERAYDLFHGGGVRFLDAVPWHPEEGAAVPVPLAWHTAKHQPPVPGELLDPKAVFIGPHVAPQQMRELDLRQLRCGFFTAAGRYLTMARNYNLKTAVDRDRNGAARGGQLYGYEALAAGTRWRAAIDADNATDLEPLAALFDGRRVGLGRSRGAEYGQAWVALAETPADPPVAAGEATEVVLHLLSDAALCDLGSGEPTLTASPEHFGLPATWRLDPERCAVATRAYSPFNGKRRRHDLERRLLARGSVLVFRGEPPVSLAEVARSVHQGVGQYRQEGLGQVAVQPWYLTTPHPQFPLRPAATAPAAPTPVPVPPLAAWMIAQGRRTRLEEDAVLHAHELAERLRRCRAKGQPWPSRSQWNRVAGIARACLGQADPGHLRRRLEAEVLVRESGGVGANQWNDRLREELGRVLNQPGDSTAAALQLYHAARQMRTATGKERGGK